MEEIEQAIIKKLQENHSTKLSESQIFDSIRGRESTKVLALKALLKNGLIGREGKGKRDCPYLYSHIESKNDAKSTYSDRNKTTQCEEIMLQDFVSEDDLTNAVELFHLLMKLKSI